MKRQAQSGSVVELVILGLVVIGAAVLILWRYISVNQTLDQTQSANDSTASVAQPTSLAFSNWTLKVQLPNSLKSSDISKVYYIDPTSQADSYYLVSSTLKQSAFTCSKTASIEDSDGAFLRFERSYSQPPSQPNAATKQLGGHYYFITQPNTASCYPKDLSDLYFSTVLDNTIFDSLQSTSQ